jgi:hypothetical protein
MSTSASSSESLSPKSPSPPLRPPAPSPFGRTHLTSEPIVPPKSPDSQGLIDKNLYNSNVNNSDIKKVQKVASQALPILGQSNNIEECPKK